MQGAETDEEDTGKGVEERPGRKEDQQERAVSWKLSKCLQEKGRSKRTTENHP